MCPISYLHSTYLFLADVLPPSFELRVRLLRKTGERVRERESSPDKSTVADKGNALNLFAFAVSSSPSSPSHSSLSLRSDNKEGEITVACQIQYRAPFEWNSLLLSQEKANWGSIGCVILQLIYAKRVRSCEAGSCEKKVFFQGWLITIKQWTNASS